MKKFTDARKEAIANHLQQFDCSHEIVAVRKREIAGGSTQFIGQCQRCGYSVGNAVARDKAFGSNGGREPPAFDSALRENWDAQRAKSYQGIEAKFDRNAFFDNYDDYLKSPAWRSKRSKVLNRANGICEGCGDNKADQVHHLTYAHVGNEFLFELVALCHPCHERLHADA